MPTYRNFTVSTDLRGVLTAALDVPERPVNVFEDSVLQELNQIVETVRNDGGKSIKFVVFRSSKPTGFLAGADIHRLKSIGSEKEAAWILEQGQQLFNKIEQLPVPTLAVIHGACMGGGLEFALACKYRLAVNDAATKLALPEVKLGLLPAWGGTQRLPKKVGLIQGLTMILEGKTLNAQKALRAGLVDGLISTPDSNAEIGAFIDNRLKGNPLRGRRRNWMEFGLESNPLGHMLALKQARANIAKHSQQYPALAKIIDSVAAGLGSRRVTDTGLATERRGFTELLFGPVAPNLIELFLLAEKAKKASTWTGGSEGQKVKKIAVIGAGTMGAGIAQACAGSGYQVVLQDIKQEFVDRGMTTIRDIFANGVKKGGLSQAQMDKALAGLTPRVDWGPSSDVDLMIEAALEQPKIKEAIFTAADQQLPPHAVLASNTSALPIDDMARVTNRASQVAGLHFFNPVHKMMLVEVVRAPQTSDDTIATLVNVVKKLGKTPVLVKQAPGFLVNRILFPYLDEAARLVVEGHPIRDIDREAKKFGMPMGPLELLDVVGIDVARDVAATLSPLSKQETPSPDLFKRMVEGNMKGQKSGQGFYNWKNGERGELSTLPGVMSTPPEEKLEAWTVAGETISPIQQRLALAMLNESRKCLNEGIVEEPWMVDLGMVLGTGFAPFRGGPMKCMQRWGEQNVTARLQHLADKLGPRYTPAPAAMSVASTG